MSQPNHPTCTDTRSRLLASARELFSSQGYSAASTRAIAARAGCNLALISHYFGSKEGLLRAAIAEPFEKVEAELRRLVSAPEPATSRLDTFIRFMVDHFAVHQAEMRICQAELNLATSPVAEEVRPRVHTNLELLASLIAQVREEGPMADVDPHIGALLLLGMLQMLFSSRAVTLGVHDTSSPAALEPIKRNISALFLQGARSGDSK